MQKEIEDDQIGHIIMKGTLNITNQRKYIAWREEFWRIPCMFTVAVDCNFINGEVN